MAKPKEEVQSQPVDELIARFQLETERMIATLTTEHRRSSVDQERKIATLTDSWQQLTADVRDLRKAIDDGLHQMRQGVSEVNVALRRTVEYAEQAATSAKVYDKLKASQPDFQRAVKELHLKCGSIQDANNNTLAQLNSLSQRLDEFEVVTCDYEETKGTVRGMDRIVADLNGAEQRRRKGISP